MTSFRTFFTLTLFLLATGAKAVIVEEMLLSSGPGWSEGIFTIINDGSEDIYALAVANNEPYGTWVSNGMGWDATALSASVWDGGHSFGFPGGAISTLDLGTFGELFPGFSGVFLYYTTSGGTPVVAGSSATDFGFQTVSLGSPFIVVGSAGSVIASGDTVHVVPLPAAVWLFGAGLGLLGLAGRRCA